MSYAGMMEDELTEQCICGKSYEDHLLAHRLCTCGHEHGSLWRKGDCLNECEPHQFKQDDARYCDWSKDGSVFRRREPNDGH